MNFSITNKTFLYIISSPSNFYINDLDFMYRFADNYSVGFVLPRVLGAANKRNIFKRRCRSIMVNLNNQLSLPSFGLIIRPKHLNFNYTDLFAAFESLSNDVLLNQLTNK